MKREKKERSVFGKLIVILLAVLAILGMIAMVGSILSSYVNPIRFVWLSYFGLMFWPIFFYCILVFLALLLMRSRFVWISVLALLIAVPGIYRSFSFGTSRGDGDLRVMSYNVHYFENIHDAKKTTVEFAGDVAKMVLENHPDVLCFQEFRISFPKKNREASMVELGEMMGLPYHYYHTKNHFKGNVIFSKYPVTALEEDIPFAEENEYGAVAKVDAGEKGLFYVVCCHLTSIQLTQDEVEVFSDPDSKEKVQEYGKSIVSKLKVAYEKRSQLVKEMLSDVPADGRAIIICGDMNDTPMSFTYTQMRKSGFVDGFVKAGFGIGYTYAGKLPLLRIDYIWGNDKIRPVSFKRLKFDGSDHYPVMMDFNVEHGI